MKRTASQSLFVDISDYERMVNARDYFYDVACQRAQSLKRPREDLEFYEITSAGISFKLHGYHPDGASLDILLLTPAQLVMSDLEWKQYLEELLAQRKATQKRLAQAQREADKAQRRLTYEQLKAEFEGNDDLL